MNERGARAEIATTNDDGPGVSDVPLGRLIETDGVPVRYFGRFSPPIRAVREFAYSHAFRPWLKKHVRDYDLLHVHALFSHLPTTAMGVATCAGVPYICRPLGLLGRWPLRQSARRKKIYLALGEAAHLRGAAAVHFTSDAEQLEASETGLGLRGIVIPHGVELPELIPNAKARLRAKLRLPDAQKIVLFLGRLHRKKGLDLLLEAFAGLAAPGVSLILAGQGDPDFERELERSIQSHEAHSHIIRTGFVAGAEKQLLLQGSDCFCSHFAPRNFGIAVLESLAAGTPVLVSDQVALAREVEKFRLGEVVPLEAKAARAALRRVLDHAADWKSSRLRQFVTESYSWAANARALSELYASILEPGRRPRAPG